MSAVEKNFEVWCQIFGHPSPQEIPRELDVELERHLLHNRCLHLGVKFPKEFMTKVHRDDVIEIYDASTYVQMWCSFNMFSYISYTPEEVVTIPFPELFDRPENIFEDIFKAFKHSLQIGECIPYNLKPYILKEVRTKRRFLVENKFIAPLFYENGTISNLVICSISPKLMQLKPLVGNA